MIIKKQSKPPMENLKSGKLKVIRQKGIDLNHVFYVVVGKQYRTENVYAGQYENEMKINY